MRMQIALGIMGLGGIFFVGDQINLHQNYTRVKGKIVSVEVDCYIEGGRSMLVVKNSNEKAYLPCSDAKVAAEAFNYKPRDIHHRVRFIYDFVSPVDKSHHKGKSQRENVEPSAYQSGKTILVYAHNKEADSSRI
jgi:hypothetical protein